MQCSSASCNRNDAILVVVNRERDNSQVAYSACREHVRWLMGRFPDATVVGGPHDYRQWLRRQHETNGEAEYAQGHTGLIGKQDAITQGWENPVKKKGGYHIQAINKHIREYIVPLVQRAHASTDDSRIIAAEQTLAMYIMTTAEIVRNIHNLRMMRHWGIQDSNADRRQDRTLRARHVGDAKPLDVLRDEAGDRGHEAGFTEGRKQTQRAA